MLISPCLIVPTFFPVSIVKHILPFLAVAFLASAHAAEIRFNRDVRPILSSVCNKCHGPDDAHREAELRLDTEEGIRHAFDGGLDGSEGWARIISKDPELVMPPPDAHVELKPTDIAAIKAWVEGGAQWDGHWSFIPPIKAAVPFADAADPDRQLAVDNRLREWIRNPIDAFVLQQLLAKDLQPNSAADKERLLRRVSLDLTGLPPSIAEIDAFLADTSDDAYEKVVDRLLKSPHFGERMTVVWMDAARYGDTSVFHADGPRDMWPWRDWVINAYNSNKPFDQFTMEQLAGDLLPESTTQQKAATGFLRNNATTDEGGLIAEEYRVEYAVDRVKTTSMVWLGLSMECAQCHNHKYDPITQQEYYQFFAYFNQAADPGSQTRKGNQSPVVDIIDGARVAQADALQKELDAVQPLLDARSTAVEPDFQKWLTESSAKTGSQPLIPGDMVAYVPLDEGKGREVADLVDANRKGKLNGPVKWAEGKFGKAFECDTRNFVDLGDTGDFDGSHGFSYGAWIKPKGAGAGAPLARMNNGNAYRGYDLHLSGGVIEPHIIHKWPSDAIKVRTKNKLKPDTWQHVFVTYDGSMKAAGVKIYVDGQLWDWTIEQDGLANTIKSKGPFYVGRRNGGSNYNGLVDDVRVYGRTLAESEVAALAGNDVITPLLAKAATERTDDENKVLRSHYLNVVDEQHKALSQKQSQLSSKIAELRKPLVNVMIMNDVPTMRETFVLERGDYASPLKDRKVEPNVPAALPPLPAGATANRLGLATWLTQPDHPLTARVAVNRYWAMLFGEGIVRSLEDFGAQGEWPSHPDLLDWLAVDFVEHGWDINHAIKQMVMSSTYRQSSAITPDKLAADPENRLLSRGARFRLQAEFVRDNALAASGLLVSEIGGPGVKPYQPPGLWNEVSLDGNLRFVADTGEKLYRRSMYTYWKRSAPAPSMTIFDAPSREKCSLRRSRTNTPLQALVTLNDPQFVEAARVLAEAALRDGGSSTKQQIIFAYRRAAGVQPTSGIQAVLTEAFHEELERFKADTEAATKFLGIGESKRDESLDAATHAAMTVVTSMILNLDETLTRG